MDSHRFVNLPPHTHTHIHTNTYYTYVSGSICPPKLDTETPSLWMSAEHPVSSVLGSLKIELIRRLYPLCGHPLQVCSSPCSSHATHLPHVMGSKSCHSLGLNHCQLSLSSCTSPIWHLLLVTPQFIVKSDSPSTPPLAYSKNSSSEV